MQTCRGLDQVLLWDLMRKRSGSSRCTESQLTARMGAATLQTATRFKVGPLKGRVTLVKASEEHLEVCTM